MTEITLRSDFDVDLITFMGSDELICRAARVSTLGVASLETDESFGLLNFLMKNRHGSPFEHGTLTFRITTPIAVIREFMRHRIGFSYSEQSARYMEMEPVFYDPPKERPMTQVGKPGAYEMVAGSYREHRLVEDSLADGYYQAWESYKKMLEEGIAREVARYCLPVGLYSTMYVTCNPRSMMAFLSLRTKEPFSTFPSFPMWEIEQVARQMEAHFAELYPLTYRAFNENGRVSP